MVLITENELVAFCESPQILERNLNGKLFSIEDYYFPLMQALLCQCGVPGQERLFQTSNGLVDKIIFQIKFLKVSNKDIKTICKIW